MPQKVLTDFQAERLAILNNAKKLNRPLSHQEEIRLKYLESKKIHDYLDRGTGDCWLANPTIAKIVQDSMMHFDGVRYQSHAFCIMPNHVHWLVTPAELGVDSPLASILHSIKSYSSHQANKTLGRTGPFWSMEYETQAFTLITLCHSRIQFPETRL